MIRVLPRWTLCHNDWIHDGDGETCATWAAQRMLGCSVLGPEYIYIYIYIYRNTEIYIYIYIYSRSELQNNAGSSPCTAQALNKTVSNAFL